MTQNFKPDVMFVGDLHIHERQEFPAPIGENPRLLDSLNILDQIASIVEENEINLVIFTGDLFELKDKIPNHILVPFAQRMERIAGSGAEILSLRGNHDFKFPEYSTTSIFPSILYIDRIYTYTTAKNNRKISFIPFYRGWNEFTQKWMSVHDDITRPDIIVFHNELPGVYYSTKMKVSKEWDFPTFDAKTFYIGGHIHQPQNLMVKNNQVVFIGTPYQIDFDDVDSNTPHGVILYDSVLHQVRDYYLNYPKFVEINLDKKDTKIVRTKGNYVRIKGTVQPQDRARIREMRDNILANGAKGVQLKVKYLTEHISRIKAEKTNYRGVIQQYLKGSQTTLNKDRLLNVGLSLLEKSK